MRKEIYVKTLSGKTLTIKNINLYEPVISLKVKIYDIDGVSPPGEQKLIFGDIDLDNNDKALIKYFV